MRTPLGRHVYAVGGNRQAAWLAGIRVTRVQLTVYAMCGLAAGLAGVLVASRLNAGYPRAGEYYELDAIAAVVVGGTSLFGGRGSIWGTLAGAFFIGILNNGLNLYHVSTYDQMIVKGVVLLAAASLDRWREQLKGAVRGPAGIGADQPGAPAWGSFGIAVLTSYLTRHVAYQRADLITNMQPGNPAFVDRYNAILSSLSAQGFSLADAQQRTMAILDGLLMRQATMRAYNDAWLLLFLSFICVAPAVLLLRKPHSRPTPVVESH